tara:strand:- start:281 stop:400 length:120 start_codon:yes stop_codon:yes gene_type:complete
LTFLPQNAEQNNKREEEAAQKGDDELKAERIRRRGRIKR